MFQSGITGFVFFTDPTETLFVPAGKGGKKNYHGYIKKKKVQIFFFSIMRCFILSRANPHTCSVCSTVAGEPQVKRRNSNPAVAVAALCHSDWEYCCMDGWMDGWMTRLANLEHWENSSRLIWYFGPPEPVSSHGAGLK